MFNFLKPKPKGKPEPTCYLFIGEHQCIGGFAEVYLAMEAAHGSQTDETKITADMAGKEVLWRWKVKSENWLCGCRIERVAWQNAEDGGEAWRQTKIVHIGETCGNNHSSLTSVPHWASGYNHYAAWYFEYDRAGTGMVTGVNTYYKGYNGDPLE